MAEPKTVEEFQLLAKTSNVVNFIPPIDIFKYDLTCTPRIFSIITKAGRIYFELINGRKLSILDEKSLQFIIDLTNAGLIQKSYKLLTIDKKCKLDSFDPKFIIELYIAEKMKIPYEIFTNEMIMYACTKYHEYFLPDFLISRNLYECISDRNRNIEIAKVSKSITCRRKIIDAKIAELNKLVVENTAEIEHLEKLKKRRL